MAGRGREDKGGGCETGAWQEGGRSEPRADAKGSVLASGEPVTKFLLTLARPGCHREVTELSQCHGQIQEQIALPGVSLTPPSMEIWGPLPMQIPPLFFFRQVVPNWLLLLKFVPRGTPAQVLTVRIK